MNENFVNILAQKVPDIKPDGRSRQSAKERSSQQQWRENFAAHRGRSPLTEFHKEHRLSDALNWLEARGITGESALFILAMVGGERDG